MLRPVALLFAGQAADEPGMGLALARRSPRAAALLALASEVCGADVPLALSRGTRDPVVRQVALIAVQLGALGERTEPADRVAGHSLGELAAWAATGAVTPEQALTLTAQRARWMVELARDRPGGLAATDVEPAQLPPDVVVAARNAPDEVVLSGPIQAVGALGRLVQRDGPWHHPWMAPAVEPLRAALREVSRAPAGGPTWVSNRDGRPTPLDQGPDRLAEQLVHPVEFVATLAALEGHRLEIVGPDRVMRGLLRRNGLTPGAGPR